MTTGTQKHVLVLGLTKAPPFAPAEILKEGGPSEASLRQRILDSLTLIKDLGYQVELHQAKPEEVTTTFAAFVEERLRSRKWDGFVIGFGLRGIPEYTADFEQLVNAGREIAPGAKMGFTTRPDDLHVTLKRMFAEEKA
ncbi:hypothetical protein K402DRAFT_398168 [Aulographum hederae CBS 113979]|uniref:Uncharacterized protein n=1 Tax=Aulographum hederae CBS 113979 TaxID=1176131 RepID=A0A6G1GLD9_9PEZI|nr:hypothetical protein K402DRAFT_398168 [Aulographum hederae CBS 113979]